SRSSPRARAIALTLAIVTDSPPPFIQSKMVARWIPDSRANLATDHPGRCVIRLRYAPQSLSSPEPSFIGTPYRPRELRERRRECRLLATPRCGTRVSLATCYYLQISMVFSSRPARSTSPKRAKLDAFR